MIYHPIHGSFLRDVAGFKHYMKDNSVKLICNFGENFFPTRTYTIEQYNEYCMTCWWLGPDAMIHVIKNSN